MDQIENKLAHAVTPVRQMSVDPNSRRVFEIWSVLSFRLRYIGDWDYRDVAADMESPDFVVYGELPLLLCPLGSDDGNRKLIAVLRVPQPFHGLEGLSARLRLEKNGGVLLYSETDGVSDAEVEDEAGALPAKKSCLIPFILGALTGSIIRGRSDDS